MDDRNSYMPTQEEIAAATAKIRAKRLVKKKASNPHPFNGYSTAFKQFSVRTSRRHVYLEPV